MPLPLIAAGVQTVAGLVQSIVGGAKARKTQRELERLETPTYTQNQGILDYYNQALSRYGVSPTDSATYKRQNQDINRGMATGINSLQDRRSALGGVSSILRASNDARLDANVAAEQEKNRRFSELGGATQAKADEDYKAFQYNKIAPYEKKYNLLSMKAGAASQAANAGMKNAFGGIQSMGNIGMLNQQYGG